MLGNQKTILVIDQELAVAEKLKELIEFMDTPYVLTAMPENWQQRLGARRLEAMFVGPAMSDEALDKLLKQLEEFDPNVPVVMIQAKR